MCLLFVGVHQHVCVSWFECAWDGTMSVPELLVATLMWWRGMCAMECFRVILCRSKYMVGLGCIIDCDGKW